LKTSKYSYAAIEQLIEKYLVKNRSMKEVYENSNSLYGCSSNCLSQKQELYNARMRYIKEYYNAASDGLFTRFVLQGLVQIHFYPFIRSDDDLDSIFASGEMMAKYASKRAGIGLEIGRLPGFYVAAKSCILA